MTKLEFDPNEVKHEFDIIVQCITVDMNSIKKEVHDALHSCETKKEFVQHCANAFSDGRSLGKQFDEGSIEELFVSLGMLSYFDMMTKELSKATSPKVEQ